MDETKPIQRIIKIGRTSIGLLGLDQALSQALAGKMPEDEATVFLYAAISRQNYIPPNAGEQYQEALRQEYRRYSGQVASGESKLTIRILGPGCVSCNRIYTMSIDILQKLNLAADIESVQELDEVWRYGITQTPALIINGQVKSAGRLPAPFEIEQWIREAS